MNLIQNDIWVIDDGRLKKKKKNMAWAQKAFSLL